MILKSLRLSNFRNYKKTKFSFAKETTFIIGPNTSGKTNLIEAIYFLTKGVSFKSEKDKDAVSYGEQMARIEGELEEIELEIMITAPESFGKENAFKKYLVNGVSKRRIDFVGNFSAVFFFPVDLDIVISSPSIRRNFLDEVLESTDREYRLAILEYTKALRQRNKLLEQAQEKGEREDKVFEYWDETLIKNGKIITQKRADFIKFINSAQKDIFDFVTIYDHSIISKERLLQYKDAEIASGVTLVGPHRDDFSIQMFDNVTQTTHDAKSFGSRGQQRLIVLQLKLLQLLFMEEKLGYRPAIILDDIFSELDKEHIDLVLELLGKQQTIITTTHQEFIDKTLLKSANVIELPYPST
ncbi:MAG: DNA replication and repair protein RecF [Candidatus Levybacteria bacterium]|nr:DNA replication and repair protein RecF [Candidatus Levybacteria bacterium]